MSLPNDVYGHTVSMTTDGTTDSYLVGGSITYSFPAGTPTPNVYVALAIQANIAQFTAAIKSYIQTLYDPVTAQIGLIGQYLASRRGGIQARANYLGQLLDWLNLVDIYAAGYRATLLSQTDPNIIVTLKFDESQLPADPGVTLAGSIAVSSAVMDPMTATPSTPSRALNTPFQISPSNAVMVFYTISFNSALGLQTGTVELRSDSSATPTTARSRITVPNTCEQVLSYLVPAGHYVSLVSSGNSTISISAQTEVQIATV